MMRFGFTPGILPVEGGVVQLTEGEAVGDGALPSSLSNDVRGLEGSACRGDIALPDM